MRLLVAVPETFVNVRVFWSEGDVQNFELLSFPIYQHPRLGMELGQKVHLPMRWVILRVFKWKATVVLCYLLGSIRMIDSSYSDRRHTISHRGSTNTSSVNRISVKPSSSYVRSHHSWEAYCIPVQRGGPIRLSVVLLGILPHQASARTKQMLALSSPGSNNSLPLRTAYRSQSWPVSLAFRASSLAKLRAGSGLRT